MMQQGIIYIPEHKLIFSINKTGFRRKISVKLFYQYIAIFFNFLPTSSNFHPLPYKSRIATAIRGLWWINITMVNSGFERVNP